MSQDNQLNSEGTSFRTIFIGGVLFLLVVGIIITFTYVSIYNKNQDAIAENDGFGSADKPIAAQKLIKMDEFDVQLTQFIPEANMLIQTMHVDNPTPEDDSVYMLVWAELTCQKTKCKGGEVVVNLVDDEDEQWPPLDDIFIDPNLAETEAGKGETISGWFAYLLPIEAEIKYVKVWEAGGPNLFAELPSAEISDNQ